MGFVRISVCVPRIGAASCDEKCQTIKSDSLILKSVGPLRIAEQVEWVRDSCRGVTPDFGRYARYKG